MPDDLYLFMDDKISSNNYHSISISVIPIKLLINKFVLFNSPVLVSQNGHAGSRQKRIEIINLSQDILFSGRRSMN